MPPPPPRVRLPRRTIAVATALIATALVAVSAAVAIALPQDGTAPLPSTGSSAQDGKVRALWRSAPANDLLPAVLRREGTETYIRLGLNPDESCAALPAAFTGALAPLECARVIEATYVDCTQTVTATVGIVVVSGAPADREHLFRSWTADANSARSDMMPPSYPVPDSVASGFMDAQRTAWQSQLSSDGTYLVFAVAGFADGRTGPGAAARSAGSGSALSATSPPVQVVGDLPVAIQNVIAAKLGAATRGPA